MNSKTYKAIIDWIPNIRKNGIPFMEKKYAPLIEVENNKIINGSAWSVLCYSYEYINSNKTFSYIRFLNTKDAPDVLSEGINISLYEGSKKVAFGKIIEEATYKLEI